MTTTTEDPMVAYVRSLHEKFEQEREAIRTRSIALGYAFGRTGERIVRGEYESLDDAGPFADFYEQHTDGNWGDLPTKYAEFQSGKDTPK